jgi:hypothetical protein
MPSILQFHRVRRGGERPERCRDVFLLEQQHLCYYNLIKGTTSSRLIYPSWCPLRKEYFPLSGTKH